MAGGPVVAAANAPATSGGLFKPADLLWAASLLLLLGTVGVRSWRASLWRR
jgi:hypothetical protein